MSYIPLREEEAAVIAESNEKMHGQGSQFAPIPAPIQAPVYVPQQQVYVQPVPVEAVAVASRPEVSMFELGTRGEFFCFYLVSLFFGLLGLLLSLCVSSTHAARLGARAGFGMQLMISGMILMFNAGMVATEEHATTVLAIGALFTFVGVLGFVFAMRAWRRAMRAARCGNGSACQIAMRPITAQV